MNLLPRRSLVAVAAVLDIALHARSGPVSAKALVGRHDLPPRHLETVLQALVRGGILKSLRGPRGGYELARERRRVSVGEIVRAVQRTAEPDPENKGRAFRLLAAVVLPALASSGEVFLRELDAMMLEDLCARAGEVARSESEVDFTI